MKNEEIAKNLFFWGSSIVFFLFISLLISALAFIFRIAIGPKHFLMASGATIFYLIFFSYINFHRGRFYVFLKALIFWACSLFFCLMLSKNFYDLSYDGQAYHQEAIIQLNHGWNPFYEQLTSSDCNNMHRWLNHYSKGVWIYSTMIFQITKNIEAGKMFHFWLIIASLLIVLSFFWQVKTFSPFLSFIMSLLISFNPVSIYQSLSFYLDGQLMSLLIIFIAALAFTFCEPKLIHYWLLLMVIPVLVNVKLTAGIYTGMILVGYMGILWVKAKLVQLREILILVFISFLLGFILIGFNPYITNTIYKGNPFYPALGTDRSDYTYPQFPANFMGKNSFTLLFYSIFSKSDNVRGPDKLAYLKIPFTVSKEELNAFTDTNAKQGGFGPLFGGAIILSFLIIGMSLLIIYSEMKKRKNQNPNSDLIGGRVQRQSLPNIILGLFCLALLLSTCLINPASSLARFIPQMWLFPIIASFLAFIIKKKAARIIGHLILIILIFNNILIAFVYYSYNYKITKLYIERLQSLAAESHIKPIPFYFGHFLSSSTLRFDRLGISYLIVKRKEECKEGRRILPNSIILKCSAN